MRARRGVEKGVRAQTKKPSPVRVRVQRCGGKPCNCSPEEQMAHATSQLG
jgi:hypothetical protein